MYTVYCSDFCIAFVLSPGPVAEGHNIYMENVLETVLEPVLEGVGKLRPTVQLSVVSRAVEALVQAWLNFILQEKIKFRWAWYYSWL